MGTMRKKQNQRGKQYRYDPADWDESKSVTVEPGKRRSAELSTSIRLPKHIVSKLRRVAQRKGGIGYQTLIKVWIAERLEKEAA